MTNEELSVEPSSTLIEAIEKVGLTPPEQIDALDHYCRLLWEWNGKINLTRHTDYDKFVTRDLFDTLQLSDLITPGEEVLDLGSGGGVPGILLAILRDDVEVSLAESVGKKAKVLESIARDLQLECPVHAARAEHVLVEMRYSTVTARAVGPLRKLMQWLQPCWESAGRLLAVKGPRWADERSEASQAGMLRGVRMRRAAEYVTPGTEINNVILEFVPK